MAFSLGRYIKTAFTNRWNLLALAGGAAFAVISGNAEVFLPLVAATEVAYLGFVGTHPKYQTYVDHQEAIGRRVGTPKQKKRNTSQTAMRILKALPVESRDRFKQLRSRLLDLRQIAEDMKRHQEESGRVGLEVFQLEGLDRLLWVFLRLQYTQASVGRFLERTDEDKIREDIKRLEKRLAKLEEEQDAQDPEHAEKVRATLIDNLETSQARLANYKKAESNHEYIDLELDRLENKITSLAELAINRQEPAFITSQVDQVARSMIDTEETLNELDFVTHLGPVEEHAPELLRETIYITE